MLIRGQVNRSEQAAGGRASGSGIQERERSTLGSADRRDYPMVRKMSHINKINVGLPVKRLNECIYKHYLCVCL